MGYPVGQKLLAGGGHFTALFAYNDVAAIGAIRALCDAGLRVPEDVAVVGFDDIPSASFQNPSLTTVRRPLRRIGEIAVQCLLDRLQGKRTRSDEVVVEPELVNQGIDHGPAGPSSCPAEMQTPELNPQQS